jgi:hypothetical protein
MANRRMLSKSISVSRQANGVSLFTQLLVTWIIPHADDWGRITADPAVLRALVLPMRASIPCAPTCTELLPITDELITAALVEAATAVDETGTPWIQLYESKGKHYLCYPSWDQHQTGLNKRTESKYPAPPPTSEKFLEVLGSSNTTQPNLTQPNGTQPNLTSTMPVPNGDGQKRTPLQLLDSLMPGRINAATSQWLTDLVADYGEDEVRAVLHIAASKEPKPTQPKAYIARVIADRAKDRTTGNDPDEDPDTRDIRRLREQRKLHPPPPDDEPWYMGPDMLAKLKAQGHVN